MAIVIREADLIEDQTLLVRTLNQNRARVTDERRYRWLYLDNPFGKAKAWIAVDDRNNAIAGFTAVFPRWMYVDGEKVLCWNCGDFSINQSYRSLGVAVQLRSAATRIVNERQVPFLYGHPNDRMKIVHLRAGHKVIGQMVRFAMPLRMDRRLPLFPGRSWVSSGLACVAHALRSTRKQSCRLAQSFQVEIFDRFAENAPFNALLEEVRGRLPIFGLRNYEYLKWRFGVNPMIRLHTLLLYRTGQLVGYAFYSFKDEAMYINDMFTLPERDISDALIAHLTDIGWEHRARAVSVTLLESNPLIQSLIRSGYLRRPETSSVIVHTAPGLPWGPMLQDKTNWFMTVGDRDI
jgi:GNAT superfamily N-acetyltransferase